MPLYNYVCLYCKMQNFDQKFEVLQGMNDRPLQKCGGHCILEEGDTMRGKSHVKRLFPVVNVHFKGTGFYETDYKDKK